MLLFWSWAWLVAYRGVEGMGLVVWWWWGSCTAGGRYSWGMWVMTWGSGQCLDGGEDGS